MSSKRRRHKAKARRKLAKNYIKPKKPNPWQKMFVSLETAIKAFKSLGNVFRKSNVS